MPGRINDPKLGKFSNRLVSGCISERVSVENLQHRFMCESGNGSGLINITIVFFLFVFHPAAVYRCEEMRVILGVALLLLSLCGFLFYFFLIFFVLSQLCHFLLFVALFPGLYNAHTFDRSLEGSSCAVS